MPLSPALSGKLSCNVLPESNFIMFGPTAARGGRWRGRTVVAALLRIVSCQVTSNSNLLMMLFLTVLERRSLWSGVFRNRDHRAGGLPVGRLDFSPIKLLTVNPFYLKKGSMLPASNDNFIELAAGKGAILSAPSQLRGLASKLAVT